MKININMKYKNISILLISIVILHLCNCQNRCQTPLGDVGSCVSLKFCPEITRLFERMSRNSATQYSMQLQGLCGNRLAPDQYPVVCCTNVETETRSTYGNTLGSQFRTCLTSDFKTGSCKPLQSCNILYDQLLNDPSNEQLKADLRTSHNICGKKNTDICCPSQQTATRRVLQQFTTEEEGCGVVSIEEHKIVGGEDSQLGAWPWMALIGYDRYSLTPFKCGGSLVSARHVITAAHCILHDLSFVRLGEFDLSTESEASHIDINVIKNVKHPQYGQNNRSDLAILLLENSVQFTDLIRPICMPNSNRLRSKSYVNIVSYVAGWGYKTQGGTPTNILQQAPLPILRNDVCRRIYRNLFPYLSSDEFDNSIVCAGYTIGGVDTCKGDSGGPLMIPEPYKGTTRYYLIGVVSYSHGCAKVPGIYISTQHWMDWLVNQIKTM